MSVKRKISVRKIIQALLTIVLTGVCITAVLSATKMHNNRTLKDVEIFVDNDKFGFVTKDEVRELLLRDGEVQPNKTKLSKLNVKQMEHIIVANPWVEEAQVYVDHKQNLHALVTQRVPVVRIFEKTGNSYYIDKNSEPMPLSRQYNYYTTVVTNVPELHNDSISEVVKANIMAYVKFIRRDTFWNAQVSQLIVRDDLKFEIVPVLGDHQVIMGDTTDIKLKFDNLFAFYNKVLNEVGWDKYEVLDLSYKGQLVASPAINWKMPVDKVINRINWVNSILGVNPKPVVTNHSPPAAAPAVKPAVVDEIKQPEPKIIEVIPAAQKPQPVKVEQPKPKEPEKVQESPVAGKEKRQEDKKPKYIYNGG